jgi:hypothetical protein
MSSTGRKIKVAAGKAGEGWRLYVLATLEAIEHNLEEATERRQRRQARLAAIREKAEDGKVAMIWSGRDCDGVRYSGSVYIVDATAQAVDAEEEHTLKWADGPCGFYLERPSVACGVEYDSRDLALEAFEDGHPHVLYG